MQRELHAERAWRHWTGRILPVLAVALLALGPAQAKDNDKKNKQREAEVAAEVESPALYERPTVIRPEGARPPPSQMLREAPRPAQRISIDRIIEQVERRYKAKVVNKKQMQKGDRLIYELRLLSDGDNKVSTVRVDAETGKEI
jgi:uncharacterized membrane protein YkoI